MKYIFLLSTLLLTIPAAGQEDVRLTRLSSRYDLVAKQSNCNVDWRGGKCDATIQLYRKKARKPFQTISIRAGDEPPIFGDFNFDGEEDLAICDGTNGGYVTASYRVYLYSRARRQFIFDASFTALSQGPAMGFFDVDKKKRLLYTQHREGCCYFVKEGYDIYKGRPRLVYKLTVDESSADRKWNVTTTRKLLNGRWRTWVKRERPSE